MIDTVGDGAIAITVLGVDCIEGTMVQAEQPGEMRSTPAAESVMRSLSWATVRKSSLG